MSMTNVDATEEESWWARRKQRKFDDKQSVTDEMSRLLAYVGHAGRRVGLTRALLLFFLAVIVAKYSVDGAYDVVLETHAPLLQTGAGTVAFGLLLLVVFGVLHRAGRRISMPTVVFFSALLMIYGGGLIYYHFAVPSLADNTALWHHLVSNGDVRDQKYRDWPEGLVTGLYWGYWNWNTLKRRQRPHFLQHVFYFKKADHGRGWGWYANLINEHPDLTEWMIFVLFPLILLFAWPAARGMWSLESLISEHNSMIHVWLSGHADWLLKVNNALTSATSTGLTGLNNIKDTLFADWPILLTGLISAQVFGRVPAYGVIDEAQEYNALRRIARTGSLAKATAWYYRMFRMNGMLIAIAQTWEEGEKSKYRDAQAFAKAELKERGAGISFMFRAAPYAIAILWIIGFVVVGLHVRI